jgi:hypothetical protein
MLVAEGKMVSAASEALDALRSRGAALLKAAISSTLAEELRCSMEARYRLDATDYELINGYSGGHIRQPVDPLLHALRDTPFHECAQSFLNTDRVVVPVNHLLWRQRDDATDALAERNGFRHLFHQDHGLIPESFPFNAWLALSKVDEGCHGLSFALPAPDGPTPLASEPERYVAQTGGELWSPQLEPGDLLLFHRFTIHGSWIVRGKPRARYSVEFRAGSLATAPIDYANVLWHMPSK